MTHVLYVCASPRGEHSAAGQAAEVFLAALDGAVSVTRLDLFEMDLPEFGGVLAQAKQKTMFGQALDDDEAAQWSAVTSLVDQFLSADHVVFAVPMWNFSLPYKLKQYIDLITHPGLTFTQDKDGPRGVGSASGTVIYARGGDYSPTDGQPDPYDFQSPYFKTWAALVGISPLSEILVQRTLGGPDAQQHAVAGVTADLQQLARQLA